MPLEAEPQREDRSMKEYSQFVGLDLHKDSIVIAVARSAGKAQMLAIVPYGAKAVVRAVSIPRQGRGL